MLIKMIKGKKYYGSGNTLVKALDNVDLTVDKGEVCVILGPSGSGKSTLLNMLGGIDCLDSGELIVNGNNIGEYNEKQLTEYRRNQVGFVFQFYNLISDLTVEENIATASNVSNNPLQVEEVLRALDIEDLRQRFPSELSGGQQQRVAIARALIKKPDILLCDELTGALDSKSASEVLKFISNINEQFGTTVLIITHDESIKNIGKRVIRMKDGKIVYDETGNHPNVGGEM